MKLIYSLITSSYIILSIFSFYNYGKNIASITGGQFYRGSFKKPQKYLKINIKICKIYEAFSKTLCFAYSNTIDIL